MTQVKNFQDISYDELMDIDGGADPITWTALAIIGGKFVMAAFVGGFFGAGGVKACDMVEEAFASN